MNNAELAAEYDRLATEYAAAHTKDGKLDSYAAEHVLTLRREAEHNRYLAISKQREAESHAAQVAAHESITSANAVNPETNKRIAAALEGLLDLVKKAAAAEGIE